MLYSEFNSLSIERQNELLKKADDLIIEFGRHAETILKQKLSEIINGELDINSANLIVSKDEPNIETIVIKVSRTTS